MNNWKEFVFNEPYVGGKIERINNVILPKQYVGFMKKHNGGKGDIGETWLELYPLEELQEIMMIIVLRIFTQSYYNRFKRKWRIVRN